MGLGLISEKAELAQKRRLTKSCILAILTLGPIKPRAFEAFDKEAREVFVQLIDRGLIELTRDQKLSLTDYYWSQQEEEPNYVLG